MLQCLKQLHILRLGKLQSVFLRSHHQVLVIHSQLSHQGTGCHRAVNTLVISLGVRLQQSAERIGMGSLGANQPLAWDVDILHTVIHLLHDSLLADHTRNGITILSALLDILGNDSLCHQRAHTIVYQYDIILCTSGIAQAPQTIADGVLIAITTLEDPLQLGDVKLVGIRLQYHFPSLETHHADGVYLRMALESLHGIDDNRYVINRHKLLWDILSHTVTNTACSQ